MPNNHKARYDNIYDRTELFQKQLSIVTDTPDVAPYVAYPSETSKIKP